MIGQVWAARRDARLQRAKLLVVRPHAIYEPAFGTRHLVATDDVDAGVGDDVIVCLGAPARASAGGNDMPVDAAVLGVVDRIELRPDAMRAAGRGARDQARSHAAGRRGGEMIRGTVVGQVWATRKARGLDGQTLLLVAACDAEGRATGRLVVASDTLDARAGEDVTVAFGSGARNVLRPGPENRDLLCDAAIAAIVEGAG